MLTIRRVDDGNPVASGMFKEMLDTDMKPTDWCWLAMDGDLVVGFASAGPVNLPRWLYLSGAGVIRSYRGHGLQRRMIAVREAAAKRAGCKLVVTYTARDNYPSANNLIRCGYRLYAPEVPFGFSDALYFQKAL